MKEAKIFLLVDDADQVPVVRIVAENWFSQLAGPKVKRFVRTSKVGDVLQATPHEHLVRLGKLTTAW
jgi:hypothetical protein